MSDKEAVGFPENSIFKSEHIDLLCSCASVCLEALSRINCLLDSWRDSLVKLYHLNCCAFLIILRCCENILHLERTILGLFLFYVTRTELYAVEW